MFSGLLKNVSILVIGTTIAQIIPVTLQPLLKRVFAPELFGVLEVYLRILGILIVVFSLKYEMAVILPKEKWKAITLIYLSFLLSFVSLIICLVTSLVWGDEIIEYLNFSNEYKYAILILPFSAFFFSTYNTLSYYLIRNKKFVASAASKISRRSAEGLVQSSSGLSGYMSNYGLFIGDLIGNVSSFIVAYYQSFNGLVLDKRFLRPRLVIRVAKEYIKLPKYNLIPELLNVFFGASLTFIVLEKFDLKEVAILEPTQRVLAVPSAFIAVAVGQVVLQEVSALVNNGKNIRKLIFKIAIGLSTIALLFYLIIHFFGPQLFSWFLGNQWEVSGIYATHLIYFYALMFVFSPLGQVLIALKKFQINALWQVFKFVLVYLLVFITFEDIVEFMHYYALIGAMVYIIYGIIIYYQVKKYEDVQAIRKN